MYRLFLTYFQNTKLYLGKVKLHAIIMVVTYNVVSGLY